MFLILAGVFVMVVEGWHSCQELDRSDVFNNFDGNSASFVVFNKLEVGIHNYVGEGNHDSREDQNHSCADDGYLETGRI